MESNLVISFNNDTNEKEERELLQQYQSLICSSIGSINSKLKLISTKSDQTNVKVTNSSRHLLDILYRVDPNSIGGLTTWKFDVIKKSVENAHFAHLFDAGLFLVHLINQSSLIPHRHRHFIDMVLKSLYLKLTQDKQHIESSHVLIKLDLTRLKFLQTLLKTSLCSNKLFVDLFDTQADLTDFISRMLKLNLNSFNQSLENSEEFVFSRIMYLYVFDSGFNITDSLIFNGILIKQERFYSDEELEEIVKRNVKNGFKCVLFDTNYLSGDLESFSDTALNYEIDLSHDFEDLNIDRTKFLTLKSLNEKFDRLVNKHKISLVLSQKVIHPSLKTHLKRRGILAIDRLSIIYAQPIADLTNCKICSSLLDLDSFDERFLGHLESIRIRSCLNETYLHFESSNSHTQTMIVCLPNETFAPEIENLIEVAQNTFRRTVMNGAAICGGPCFYTYCLCYLWKNLEAMLRELSDEETILKRATIVPYSRHLKSIFQPYFIQLLDNDIIEYRIDLDSGHLFHEKSSHCVCNLFNSSKKSRLVGLDDDLFLDTINFSSILSDSTNRRNRPSETVFIDCLESKLNALTVSRDILSTILNVGVFIHDSY